MALSSLKFDASTHVAENRGGYLIFDGSNEKYHEWEFRTTMRIKTAKKDDKLKVVQEVVDSLRGDAASVAIDIGTDGLIEEGGIELLIEGIRKLVFPVQRHEAKTLLKVGQLARGTMSRQRRESMVKYVLRRRRWWQRLKSMDKEVVVSDSMLGDWMLDCSGLSYDQQKMVLTSNASLSPNV